MKQAAKNLPWGLWIFWTLVGVVLVVGLAVEENTLNLSAAGWIGLVLGLAPLIGAQLTLGSPRAAESMRVWLAGEKHPLLHPAGGITGLFLLSGLLAGRFDPYATVIFAFGAFAALGTLRQIQRGKSGLTWADVAVWLLIWIPFDLRWNYDLWFGLDGFAYNWWAVALTVLAVVGWYGFRELPDFGYKLIPNGKDFITALIATVIFAAIVIPIGLTIDFLHFPPSTPLSMPWG